MNLPSCPRCGLYLSARGCTPERCANPEGAEELERLGNEATARRNAILDDLSGQLREAAEEEAKPPSDLDTFRAMLERAGVKESGDYMNEQDAGDRIRVTFDCDLYFDKATGALLTREEMQRRREAADE